MARIVVLGAGAWGTALAITYAQAHAVSLWTLDPTHAADMLATRENKLYLPGLALTDAIQITADFATACAGAELALIVTPVAGLRPTLKNLAALAQCPPVLWACKGFEAGTGLLPHEVAKECLRPDTPYGVLTGPSFADEVRGFGFQNKVLNIFGRY